MDEHQSDDTTQESTLDDSSSSLVDTSSNAAGGDTNDEEVKVKKGEWEQLQKKLQKLDSLEVALQQEREKTKRRSLSEVDGDEVKPKKDDYAEAYRKFRSQELAEERKRYEEDVKVQILKKFPSLASVNDYGMNLEVVENYRDLLEGRIKRGFQPRTREDVYQLVERAVRMTKPELFAQNEEELGKGYTGMSRGTPVESDVQSSERLSPQERAFHQFVEQKEKLNKRR